MSSPTRVEVKANGVVSLQMQDEKRKNVFSDELIEALITSLDELEQGRKTKVLVLSGLPDVFCAGAEKSSLLDLCDGKIQVKDLLISERLLNASFPIVAAMEGHAVGGGLIIAACSDIVLAARESRYGAVFMSLGFTPGMGCTRLLPELVGSYVANEMMYTAKCFKGRELEKMGTHINYIIPKADVMPKALNIAFQIGEKSLESIHLLKRTLSLKKKRLLLEARGQEDLMHRLSFAHPATRQMIEEFYGK
jgi:polyketide biosynthesis enoyl-CoA hydratase PksI